MGTELSGGRVLVVDDDRVNRMLLTRSLGREGPDGAPSATTSAAGPRARHRVMRGGCGVCSGAAGRRACAVSEAGGS